MKLQGKTHPTRRPKGFIHRALRPGDFDESLNGFLIKDVAVMLNRGYNETRYAIKKYGLRDRFPAHGAESMWISRKGYSL
jgi:hypothetical protein